QRLQLNARDPLAVLILERRPDGGPELDGLPVREHGEHRELRGERLHHGMGEPSCEKNRPLSALLSLARTSRRPATDVSGASGAPAPPMSVRTQPGLSATTMMPRGSSVAARPFTSML